MRTLILDGLFVYKDLERAYDSKTSLEIIFEKSKINKFERYILLNNGNITDIPQGIKNVEITEPTPSIILNAILSEAKNTEFVAVFDAGNPLYDHDFIEKMFERHEKYFADYTYCIGYPEGLAPVILRKEVLKEFIKIADEDEIRKDYLFHTLSKDINSFDIETFLSPFDIRILRVKLGLNDAGEELLTGRVYSKFAKDFSIDNITEYYFKNPGELYTVPYMLALEITNSSPVTSIYYPEQDSNKVEMDKNDAVEIIKSMHDINPDMHLLLGGQGEPLSHPDFFSIYGYVCEKEVNCVIETYGTLVDEAFITKIKEFDNTRISFVIKLDCYDQKTYDLVHAGGDFTKAKNTIILLKDVGIKTYKLAVRMHENEIEIEKYIRNKEADDLIIRKFSNYCGALPDKKVVDLSPLKRIPCFHLRREVNVNVRCRATLCMYALKEELGDLKKEKMPDIIKKMEECYKNNAGEKYLSVCSNCDDYYVFNF